MTHHDDNWDFADAGMKETQDSTHFFHHWTAKFIPQIPRRAIQRYARPGDIVLDPFMGSGTTLVEAARLGHDAWGTDINPLAYRIARSRPHWSREARPGFGRTSRAPSAPFSTGRGRWTRPRATSCRSGSRIC
jgi:hypothetical protein